MSSERWLWAAFGAVLLAAFVYLIWLGRGNNFFFDEWGWLEQRAIDPGWLLRPYNDHLQLVPLGVYYLLYHTVGLDHYWVWRVIQTSIHLGAVAVLFEFARRRLQWLALPLVVPVALLGSGWDYVLWPVSMGFVASIGLGIGALLALERDDRRGDVVAVALLLVGLVCCEFAAFFAVGIAVEILLRDRSLTRAWVGGIPLAAYALWWLVYQQGTAASHNLGAVPGFVGDLAASGVGGLLGLDLTRGRSLLIVGMLILGWRIARAGAISPRAAGLLVTMVTFWLAVALARAQLGTPDATRYVYTSAILLVLLVAEVFRGASAGRWQLIAAGFFVVFALFGNLRVLRSAEGALRVATRQVSAELTALDVARATAPAGLIVDPRYAPALIADPYFDAVDQLHSSPADTASELLNSPETARTAADSLLVRADDLRVTAAAPIASSARPVLSFTAISGATTTDGRCLQFRPSGPVADLDVTLPPHGIEVHASAGTRVEIRVRRFATGFEGAPLTPVPGGADTSIEPVRDGSTQPWHLQISPARSIVVCARP